MLKHRKEMNFTKLVLVKEEKSVFLFSWIAIGDSSKEKIMEVESGIHYLHIQES